jgi:hypothetical protein
MSRLGAGITLLVIGAILTFAVNVNIPGVGEYALGVILMVAGVALVLLAMALDHRRSRTVVERPFVEERRVVEDPPVETRRRRRFV